MKLELSTSEVELLDSLLESLLRERLRQIHHSDSRDYRRRLEHEAEMIDTLRARLAAGTRAA